MYIYIYISVSDADATLLLLILQQTGYAMISVDYMRTAKIPHYEKQNKASSGAEEDAKSAELGTYEVCHQSDLSKGQSSA